MTEGEKMVWAAAYASKYSSEYYYKNTILADYKIDIPSIIEFACTAVKDMKGARDDVETGFGATDDIYLMLKEILGEQS